MDEQTLIDWVHVWAIKGLLIFIVVMLTAMVMYILEDERHKQRFLELSVVWSAVAAVFCMGLTTITYHL